ncbi:hypothetical protein TSUD_96820 [Trifolium subterraneum]|nr:hypothetical protein TSUD_96820 [Trifolium subterraneum]
MAAVVIFMFIAAILTTTAVISASPVTLTLGRAFLLNHEIDLDKLRVRDTSRHGRILMSSKDVVFFDVYSMHLVG